MRMPRYGNYKGSNSDWLGEVPSNWTVGRLKSKVQLVTQKALQRTHPVALENIEGWSGRFIPSASNFEGDGVAFLSGDILFGKLRPYLAKAYLADCPGEAVGDFHVLRPTSAMNGRYLQYQILNQAFIDIIDGSTFGSRMPRVSWEFLGNMQVAIPFPEEQTAIATFLDHETAKIDVLIAEQEKLIALLAEKRQATISHAVTKGVIAHDQMKESGVDWLGAIPAHWNITRIKYVVQTFDGIQMGPFGGMLLDLDTVDTGFKVYGQENTISGDFSRGSRWISNARFKELERYSLQIDDLVLTRKGSLGNARLVQELPQPGICDSDTIRVRVNERAMRSEFLTTLLHEAEYVAIQLAMAKRGAILSGVNTETIANLCVVAPPPREQKAILDYIRVRLAKFKSVADSASKAIALLKERRSALIAAAVTGQIDVRGATPRGTDSLKAISV